VTKTLTSWRQQQQLRRLSRRIKAKVEPRGLLLAAAVAASEACQRHQEQLAQNKDAKNKHIGDMTVILPQRIGNFVRVAYSCRCPDGHLCADCTKLNTEDTSPGLTRRAITNLTNLCEQAELGEVPASGLRSHQAVRRRCRRPLFHPERRLPDWHHRGRRRVPRVARIHPALATCRILRAGLLLLGQLTAVIPVIALEVAGVENQLCSQCDGGKNDTIHPDPIDYFCNNKSKLLESLEYKRLITYTQIQIRHQVRTESKDHHVSRASDILFPVKPVGLFNSSSIIDAIRELRPLSDWLSSPPKS
jgi:hypothetical protein